MEPEKWMLKYPKKFKMPSHFEKTIWTVQLKVIQIVLTCKFNKNFNIYLPVFYHLASTDASHILLTEIQWRRTHKSCEVTASLHKRVK